MNSLKLKVGREKELAPGYMGLRWPVKDESGATIKTTRTRDEARKFIADELARSPEATS